MALGYVRGAKGGSVSVGIKDGAKADEQRGMQEATAGGWGEAAEGGAVNCLMRASAYYLR